MYDIELKIKPSDWLHVLFTGVMFSTMLSTLGYLLLEHTWTHGAVFGAILGFTITLFSLIFITLMNQKILPKVSKNYWVPLAVFFSFISGFAGTLASIFLAHTFHIELITLFESHVIRISLSIGVLTYIVGALLYRFVKMRNAKELVDQHYLQSRLSSLETQLNPHFLFNALNSIAELIHQDPYKAETAILKVSSFLRNTMNEAALIPLRDELKNVNDYIELENIRFGGKIKMHTISSLPSINVPKFSIQLLVENAIKHGLITKQELEITLSYDPSLNVITLSNNGKPIKQPTFGIGLTNLIQRLELLCKGTIQITDTQTPTFKIYLGECHENTHC